MKVALYVKGQRHIAQLCSSSLLLFPLCFQFLCSALLHPTLSLSLALLLSLALARSARELKHRAAQQPNEPKFQIHDYIASEKQKSGCCGGYM